MTKYSTQFKIKVVQEYQKGGISLQDLCDKYAISDHSAIKQWNDLVIQQGFESLKVKRTKATYTTKFKLRVVNYYRTHELGASKVAAKFNLNPTQVYLWYRRYQKEGIVGLRPKAKGRPRKTMNKRTKHSKKSSLAPTKEEQYQQEIADLKAKLAYQEMELAIIKKLRALRKHQEKNKH